MHILSLTVMPRYAPTISSVGSYYSLSAHQDGDGVRRIMRPKQSKYYRIDDDEAISALPHSGHSNGYPRELTPELIGTPPPLNINDGYLDDLVGDQGAHRKRKKKRDGHSSVHRASLSVNVQIVNTPTEDTEHEMKTEDDDEENDCKEHRESDVHPNSNQKQSARQSAEHSLSVTVPDSEFSVHELPLRTV